jgi:hypothetical protein
LGYSASLFIAEPIMHACKKAESLALCAGGIRSFVFTEPTRLRMARGCVWLTIAGMPDDYWMRDGEEITLPSNRQVVVEAHKIDSVLHLVGVQEECRHDSVAGKTVCTES